MTKTVSRWHSTRIEQEISLVRWGHWGQPVLLFPTAGGDAEECERMLLVAALNPLLEAGRIKLYCCDSAAGAALAAKTGSVAYRCQLLNRYQEYVAHEVLPAIRTDCQQDDAEPIAAGASIGAFMAISVAARYPAEFRAAIGMSGSYDLERLLGFQGTEDFYFASPLLFLPNLEDTAILEQLKKRFFLMAYGQGRWENPEEAWRMAEIFGAKGVPNRVDPWGHDYDHDWPTWREMLPLYLDELVA